MLKCGGSPRGSQVHGVHPDSIILNGVHPCSWH